MINLKHFLQRKKRRKRTEEKNRREVEVEGWLGGRWVGGLDRGEELKGTISEKMEGRG